MPIPVLLGPPVVSEISTPIKVDLAHNKIVVNVQAYDPVGVVVRTGLVYYLEVWVPETYLSNNYVLLDTLEAREAPKKNVGGADIYPGAYFEIDSLLRGVLESTAPDFEQDFISVCPNLITPYFCKAIIKNNDIQVLSLTYTSKYAMKSGIAEKDFEAYGNYFFDGYIGAGKRFLTYKPDMSKVTEDQPEFLYFLTNYSKPITKINVEVTEYDGSQAFHRVALRLSNTENMQVYCIPVGMKALGVSSDVKKYSVYLSNQDGYAISEVRTFLIEKRHRRYKKYFLFENSLGVYDSLPVFGETEELKKVSKQVGEKVIGYDYLASASETVVTDRTAVKEMKVAIHWSSTKLANYLTDFLYSRAIFLKTDRSLLAMECVSETLAIADKMNFHGISVTLRYSQKETNFSELPVLTGVVSRPTGWRALTSACQIDERGRRNGMTSVVTLEKYYLDDNSLFLPRTIKPNIVGKDGYLAAAVSSACGFSTTPFLSAEISRQGTFVRQNCGDALVGGYATIVIPSGAWGSTINQADADAKAEAEWQQLNTQAYANVNGTCSPFPWAYVIAGGVPADRFWVRYQTGNQQATNNSGMYSGSASYRPGNMWFCQLPFQTNQTDVYPTNTWDVSYPVRTSWTFFVYNDNTARTWKYYLNGVLQQTVAITSVNTEISLTVMPASGDRVFFLIE